MIITCEKCGVSFNLDERLLKPEGSKVRCSKCKTIFLAHPPSSESPPHKTPDEPQEKEKASTSTAQESKPSADTPEKAAKTGKQTESDNLSLDMDADEGDSDDLSLDLDEDDDKELTLDTDDSEDLSLDLDMDDAGDETSGEEDSFADDLELELDLDDSNDAATMKPDEREGKTKEPKMSLDDDSNDLKLELDGDDELDLALEPDESEADNDIGDDEDFSELEKMLETDDDSGADEKNNISSDLDFEQEEEIDLLDLEKTLEMDLDKDEEDEDEDDAAEVELELSEDEDVEIETITGEEDEADMDMSDIEEMLEMEEEEQGKVDEDEELELEFVSDVEETEDEPLNDTGDIDLEFDTEPSDLEAVEDDYDDSVEKAKALAAETEAEKNSQAAAAKSGGLGRVVLVSLILIFLAAGGGVALVLLEAKGVEVPYLTSTISPLLKPHLSKIPALEKMLTPPVKDPYGKVKIDLVALDHALVKERGFFIITGSIKNGYESVRSFISLRGKIKLDGQIIQTSKTVYAGNILSDDELQNLDANIIEKRLKNKFGDNRQNLNIPAGKEISYMIVFFKYPEKMDEYQVEVIGSTGELVVDDALLEEEKSYLAPIKPSGNSESEQNSSTLDMDQDEPEIDSPEIP